MAERATRLIVFYGTEQQRQHWVREKNLDPLYVVLAANAMRRLQGWAGPVDTWICSGADGLSRDQALELAQLIRLLNTHNE